MPTYVRFPDRSWHSFLTYTPSGSVLTRCGRLIEGPDHQLADALPLDQPSCESCLRLAARDGEAPK